MIREDQLQGRGEGPSQPQRQLENQLRCGAEETLHGLEHEGLALPPGVKYRVEVSEEDPERTEEEVEPGQQAAAPASPHLPELQTAGGQAWSQDQPGSEGSLQVVALQTHIFTTGLASHSFLTSRK